MRIERLGQPRVLLFTPDIYKDNRGYFTETYNKHYGFEAKQGNQSFSKKGTVRGLHYQEPGVSKLVWVSSGRILDVAFNLTTGEYVSRELDSQTHQRLLVPAGYAHGFQALEDSVVHYLMDGFYDPQADYGINPDAVKWPIEPMYLSEKDKNAHQFLSK